jgi:hypothetical protein
MLESRCIEPEPTVMVCSGAAAILRHSPWRHDQADSRGNRDEETYPGIDIGAFGCRVLASRVRRRRQRIFLDPGARRADD